MISQFAGYEKLKPIDLDSYRARYANIGRLDLILEAEGDTIRRYQVAKQADTLMLFYLFTPAELRGIFTRLGYRLTAGCIRRTISYYRARVTDGSTLSRVVYAWVGARADRAASWQDFTEALAADMADTQGGTTSEGIHLGAMAGTIDLLQRCYTGLQTRDGTLTLDPLLPTEITRLRLTLTYRGHQLDVHISHGRITVASAPGPAPPIKLVLAGTTVSLHPGRRVRQRLAPRPAGRRPHPAAVPAAATQQAPHPAQEPAATATDPVCGMVIEQSAAASTLTYQGQTYFFCSSACQQRFEAWPGRLAPQPHPGNRAGTGPAIGCRKAAGQGCQDRGGPGKQA